MKFSPFFNQLKMSLIFVPDKTNRNAGCARSAGPPNPVNVIGGRSRQIIIHHNRQVLNINAACGDIGRNQQVDLTILELTQNGGALFLI